MEERITYDIPPEFTDEEKWLKFFSTKQAKVFLELLKRRRADIGYRVSQALYQMEK